MHFFCSSFSLFQFILNLVCSILFSVLFLWTCFNLKIIRSHFSSFYSLWQFSFLLYPQFSSICFSISLTLKHFRRSLKALGNAAQIETCVDWIINHPSDIPESQHHHHSSSSSLRVPPEVAELGFDVLQMEAAVLTCGEGKGKACSFFT